MKKLTKEGLICIIAERQKMTKESARFAVNLIVNSIKELVDEDYEINIGGFAKFFSKMTNKRQGWDPSSGKMKVFESRKKVKIKVSPNFLKK